MGMDLLQLLLVVILKDFRISFLLACFIPILVFTKFRSHFVMTERDRVTEQGARGAVLTNQSAKHMALGWLFWRKLQQSA